MANCKILTVANQKGGTAKTSTVINLAYALSMKGKKVLVCDFDPQANLSMCFGIEYPDELKMSVHHVMTALLNDEELPDKKEYIISNGKLDIIPSNINLSITEINLRDELGGERTLSTLLETLRPDYDVIIIDTNPYLGMLTINALAACDRVLIPVSTQLWSATGLNDLMKIIVKVKKKINPQIMVEGILLTMCDERTNLYREVKALVKESFLDKVNIFKSEIPTTVKVGEANFRSLSVMELNPKNKAAIAYAKFAQEVIENVSTR